MGIGHFVLRSSNIIVCSKFEVFGLWDEKVMVKSKIFKNFSLTLGKEKASLFKV